MLSYLTMPEWSPHVVGIGIGLLSCVAFVLSDKPIGCSTAFARTSGMLEQLVRGPKVRDMAYFRQVVPEIDWEWMLVIGVFIGATLSATLSGDRQAPEVSPVWRARFGDSQALRLTAAFVAGGLMMFGARLAQGCTSGHGISGTLQLAISSWLFILLAFGIATVTAWIVYGRKGAEHV